MGCHFCLNHLRTIDTTAVKTLSWSEKRHFYFLSMGFLYGMMESTTWSLVIKLAWKFHARHPPPVVACVMPAFFVGQSVTAITQPMDEHPAPTRVSLACYRRVAATLQECHLSVKMAQSKMKLLLSYKDQKKIGYFSTTSSTGYLFTIIGRIFQINK